MTARSTGGRSALHGFKRIHAVFNGEIWGRENARSKIARRACIALLEPSIGWRAVVFARSKSLTFDIGMLMSRLRMLADAAEEDPYGEFGGPNAARSRRLSRGQQVSDGS